MKTLWTLLYIGFFLQGGCTANGERLNKAAVPDVLDLTIAQNCQQLLAKIYLPYADTPCFTSPINSEQLLASLPKLKNGYVDLKAANLVEDSQLLFMPKRYEVGFSKGKDYKILGVYPIRENVGMILTLENLQNFIENGPTQMIRGHVVDGRLSKAKIFEEGRYAVPIVDLATHIVTLQDTAKVRQFYDRLNKGKIDFRELNSLPPAETFKEDFWLDGDELTRSSLSIGRHTSRFNEIRRTFD